MTMKLRDYQERAIHKVEQLWAGGARSVCLVAPTGSGKTEMGARLVRDYRTIWAAHRRELVQQAAGRLERLYGKGNVGEIMPGGRSNPEARIQVGTVETLLGRDAHPIELLVLDEAHHYVAPWWKELVARYPKARTVGLTATPQRKDGTALGDIFEKLEVAASYKELLEQGVIVPWTIYAPPTALGHDYAMDVLEAWRLYSGGDRTFAYFLRRKEAYKQAARWRANGIVAKTIESKTDLPLRAAHMEGFRGISVQVLTNVYTLTEGVDVPDASVILLARPFHHRSGYIQACGRAGRSAEGKTHAVLIDLCGSSSLHGSPVDDVIHSLDGMPKAEGRDDIEPRDREFSEPAVVDVGLAISPLSTFLPPGVVPQETAFRPRKRAHRVEDVLDKIARRSGAEAAAKMRGTYGGLAE
jgi:DNA repair protein RadD